MLQIVYKLATKCYFLSIRFYAFFNEKAKKWVDGRKNWQQILKDNTVNWNECIWFHCASLGEFEQGRPLLEKIKKEHPSKKILLSFFSPSGYEVRKNYNLADFVCYLPADTYLNAKQFIEISKCSLVIFVKYEWWYFYFKTLNQKEIPLYIISTLFRPQQIFFKWYGGLHRKMLTYCSHIFCQDESSIQILEQKLNFTNASLSGDTRYDTVLSAIQIKTQLPIIEAFKNNNTIIIGGSTYKREDEILVHLFNKSAFDAFKFIITPHDIDIDYCQNLKQQFNNEAILFSEIDKNNVSDYKILIVDKVGLLLSIYTYADYALVGGGFGKGIHNILEAAVRGIPVFGGPNWKKSIEVEELRQLECFYEVNSAIEMEEKLTLLIENEDKKNIVAKQLQSFFEQKKGATEIIYQKLNLLVD